MKIKIFLLLNRILKTLNKNVLKITYVHIFMQSMQSLNLFDFEISSIIIIKNRTNKSLDEKYLWVNYSIFIILSFEGLVDIP